MAATQSDIITTVTETRHESEVNSKQKLMVPRRIIEEEVWFSGSELKTDNSSSEDEHAERSMDIQDRIKKGAKKKTKTVTQSPRNKKNILREKHREEMIAETTIIKTVEENTTSTSTTTSTSLSSDSKNNELVLSSQVGSNYSKLENFLTKCEDDSHNLMKLSCNKADDEKSQLYKIKLLQERINKAESAYLEARSETNRLVMQMEKMLINVAGLEGPEWTFFSDITQKWVQCLSGSDNQTNFPESDKTDKSQDIEKHQLKKSRQFSQRNKDKNKKLIKIRKGTKCNIVLRNIKQCSKTKFLKDIKMPPLNECELSRLNSLLSSEENDYHVNEKYMGYKLQSNELEKLANISTQLTTCRLNDSKHSLNGIDSALNLTDEYLEVADSNQDLPMNTEEYIQIQNASLTDSQKQRLFNASQSNLCLSDSVDEYGSCDELRSEFASSSNIEI